MKSATTVVGQRGESINTEVERRLVAHYLRSDGHFGSAPLRFIDATTNQLREALECQGDPLLPLTAACGPANEAEHLYARGFSGTWADKDSPGYFRFLVLTCAVSASAVTNSDTRNFRVNLARAFNRHDPFHDLTALPTLWKRLQLWCAQKRKAGIPLREVTLTNGTGYRIVGYTHAMTFPAWRDVLRLRTLSAKESAPRIGSNIDRESLRLARIVQSSGAFEGPMLRVANEYVKYHQAGASLLSTHPFRAAALAAIQAKNPRAKKSNPSIRIELRIQLEVEDAELTVRINWESSHEPTDESDDDLVGSPQEVVKQLPTWLGSVGNGHVQSPLLSLLRIGVVPMFEERFGLWVAGERIPAAPTRCRVLWHADAIGPIRKLQARSHRLCDRWRLTEVLSQTEVGYVLEALPLGPSPKSVDLLRLGGGFETASGYLGRGTLLPRVWVPPTGRLSLSAVSAEETSIVLKDAGEGWYVLESSAPVEGQFRFRVEERIEGAEPLSQERVASFVSDAPEHLEYREPNPQRWEMVRETVAGATPFTVASTQPIVPVRSCCTRLDTRYEDLLEALYARGKAGWSEFELVALFKGILGSDSPSPWDLLRSLEESGWLRCIYAVSWGVRRWWLVPPHLLSASAASDCVVLGGSTTAAIRSRFVGTARRLGAEISEHEGVGPYSPSILFARGVSADNLASETGWPIANGMGEATPSAPACWPNDGCDPASHELVASWSWSDTKFSKPDQGTRTGVTIDRFRRQRGDRRDVFRVSSESERDWVGWSRVVAIAEAYRRAQRHFLNVEDRLLVRVPLVGHLPLAIANRIGLMALRFGGPVPGQDGWRYAYARSICGVASIRSVLGQCFVLDSAEHTVIDPHHAMQALGLARHRPHVRAGTVLAGVRYARQTTLKKENQ